MADTDTAEAQRVAEHEHSAWQGAAPIYEDYVALMTANSGQRDLILAVAGLSTDSEILDVGCGPGLLAAQFVGLVKRVVGIDFAANMISAAKSRFPNIEFHEADAEHTKFTDESFDCVVVNYCAHHLARPEIAFMELLRILRPGGRIVVVHPIQSRQACWGSFLRALLEELPPETNPSGPLFHLEEPGDYVSLLTRCGFERARCEVRVKPVRLESLNALLTGAWVITGLGDQPEDVQERVRSGTAENAGQYRIAGGSYEFPDEVLLAWADSP